MAKIGASKEDITGGPPLPEGMYDVQLKGFKPKMSKKRDSVNLNPDIRVINHPTQNDKKVFVSMNTNAPFMWHEICHAFGCPLEEDTEGNLSIPGDFSGDIMAAPDKSVYTGPLLNQQAKIYVIQREYNGKTQNDVKQYVCRVAGCSEKHNDNLAKV